MRGEITVEEGELWICRCSTSAKKWNSGKNELNSIKIDLD